MHAVSRKFITHVVPTSVVLAVLVLIGAVAPSHAQQSDKRLWNKTGETHHGQIEPQLGPATPATDPVDIDPASLEQVARRWQRLRDKTQHQTPPLRVTVPVPEHAPDSPPTELGGDDRAPNDFIFVKNTDATSFVPPGFSATVNEPSVAGSGGDRFFTGNWYGLTSSDGGNTFSFVDPFTGPFPPATGGFCCDQVTTYSPAVDTLFYMQQYLGDATNGVQRINVDQGADGSFDCFYDISPQIMGFPASNFSDFPDLTVANGWLYHSSNIFSTVGLGFTGAFVARYSLPDIAACSSVPFDSYTDPSFFSFKLTRGVGDIMYFADHISNASMRIWRWPTGDAAPTSFDRAVSAWTDNARSCPGPDGNDWCTFIDRRMTSAWVADGTVGFTWTASQDGTFPMPYTRVAQFAEGALVLTGEPIIWSGSIAFAYASAAVNGNGDIGGTIMAGGTSLHPSCIAWIADDVNGDSIAPLENQIAMTGTSGPGINRSGDFNSANPNHPNDLLWQGACVAHTTPTDVSARYVLFGREGSHLIFADSFESGDTSAW